MPIASGRSMSVTLPACVNRPAGGSCPPTHPVDDVRGADELPTAPQIAWPHCAACLQCKAAVSGVLRSIRRLGG